MNKLCIGGPYDGKIVNLNDSRGGFEVFERMNDKPIEYKLMPICRNEMFETVSIYSCLTYNETIMRLIKNYRLLA